MLNTVVLLHIFVETMILFQDSIINRKSSKEQHLFETNVFAGTFDQFNVSLLKKYELLSKKKKSYI